MITFQENFLEEILNNKIMINLEEIQKIKNEINLLSKKNSRNISYSQISLYNDCPNKWYLSKKYPIYIPNIHLLFGTVFHNIIQELIKEYFNNSLKSKEEYLYKILEYYKSTYIIEFEKNNRKHFSNENEMDKYYKLSKEIYSFIYDNLDKLNLKDYTLLDIELPLFFEIKKNINFIGYIDMVLYNEKTNSIKIIDFKSSKNGWTKKDKINITKISQLYLYKENIKKQYNLLSDINIEYEYIIIDKNNKPKIDIFIPKYDEKIIKDINLLLENFLKSFNEDGSIKEEKFTKIPNKYCNYCPYYNIYCDGKN